MKNEEEWWDAVKALDKQAYFLTDIGVIQEAPGRQEVAEHDGSDVAGSNVDSMWSSVGQATDWI